MIVYLRTGRSKIRKNVCVRLRVSTAKYIITRLCELWLSIDLSFQIRCDIIDGVEVFGDEFFIFYGDIEVFFQEVDQFQDTGGVDNALFQKGCFVFETVVVAEQEVFDDECSDFRFVIAQCFAFLLNYLNGFYLNVFYGS